MTKQKNSTCFRIGTTGLALVTAVGLASCNSERPSETATAVSASSAAPLSLTGDKTSTTSATHTARTGTYTEGYDVGKAAGTRQPNKSAEWERGYDDGYAARAAELEQEAEKSRSRLKVLAMMDAAVEPTDDHLAAVFSEPEEYVGDVFKVYGAILQHDDATGEDSFLAETYYQPEDIWVNGELAEYEIPGDADELGLRIDLSRYVEDDEFTSVVMVAGSYSYRTVGGEERTVPSFLILSISPSEVVAEETEAPEPTTTKPEPTRTTAEPTYEEPEAFEEETESVSAYSLDPDFGACKAAKAAGYGPYYEGSDPEYNWYTDRDHDGVVCE